MPDRMLHLTGASLIRAELPDLFLEFGRQDGHWRQELFDPASGDVLFDERTNLGATAGEIEALVAQSQKRSAVYDIITNPTNVTVEVA